MSSLGVDRRTGKPLADWPHIRQSLGVIISTAIGERVARRPFGGGLESMIDRPMNIDTIVTLYMKIAEAIEPREIEGIQMGEPRFQLDTISISPTIDGKATVELRGIVFPRGHLGDRTPAIESRAFQFLDIVRTAV